MNLFMNEDELVVCVLCLISEILITSPIQSVIISSPSL